MPKIKFTFEDGSEAYLEHHGIKGMRWGVRRYRNEDGSLAKAGQQHEQYLQMKKEGKTGYREHIGGGAYAVWPDKKTFNKTVNKKKKERLKQAKTVGEKLSIRSETKRYKQKVEIDNMLIRGAYNEAAKRIKDQMKADLKGIPVSQVRKNRHKTEQVLNRIGAVAFISGAIIGYGYLGSKLGW